MLHRPNHSTQGLVTSPDTANRLQPGPKLEFEQVCLHYGHSEILQAIDFQVESGQIMAVVGPNGGGKSSLLRCLLGQAPHTGHIRIHWAGSPGVIGYVPQALEFDRSLPMTVLDFMRALSSRRPAFLPLKGQERQQLESALLRVGLVDKLQRRMGDLSGGERQRVLMAQSLIPAPDLLILDEPMAALDEAGVQVFQELLTQLQAEGTTILWVEHDLEAVRRLATRVIGINRGLLFNGDPKTELTPDKAMALFSHQFFATQ